MARPWQTLDASPTADGLLELRRRGERDFLITLAGRVLMNSAANRSELALGRLACAALAERSAPRVLVGGLGMGCTLRACLDTLPAGAQVVVAELNEVVARWCRGGPLAELTGGAANDPRVSLRIHDVADAIREAARPGGERFDAVLLDLYEGPRPVCPPSHPHYGRQALARTRAALCDGGVLAVWLEEPAPAFERSLERAGFQVRRERAGSGGRRHAVVLATRVATAKPPVATR
jgi:spermidine synthase